jgi:poly-gamma-glutamate synthesis protein (capsule biosynthesis protein)
VAWTFIFLFLAGGFGLWQWSTLEHTEERIVSSPLVQETKQETKNTVLSAPSASAKKSVQLSFVGDILLGEYVGTLMADQGFAYPYVHARADLHRADVTVGNLETAVTDPKPKPGLKPYEFRSDPATIPAFAEAGFDLVNLANNHTMDFGADGLRDTMNHLLANSILHVGAGENADGAYKAVFVQKNDIRMAFLGFSRVIPNGNWKAGPEKIGLAETYDYRRPIQAIETASRNADVVIVLVHWGEERATAHDPIKQGELGRRFIDAGADLVIGTHPHILQGFEYYKDRWIAYSLGNFIFTKSTNPLTYESGILDAMCEKSGACALNFKPYAVVTPQPQQMAAKQSQRLFQHLSSISVGAMVTDSGAVLPTQASDPMAR